MSTPQKRQLAMVMDLNKCLGCQTCTVSCKRLWTRQEGMDYMWWNTVNTMPGAGTPKNWEKMGGGFKNKQAQAGHRPTDAEFGKAWNFNHQEVFMGGKGSAVHLKVIGEQPDWGPNWDEDQGGGEYPDSYYFYLPRICNHCTHPACKEACPRKAIEKRGRDGIVVVNEERCRGYRFCQEACPYKKIYFNHQKKVSQKCIFCFPRVEQNVANACARSCPGRLRFVGYQDDPEGPIYKLVHKWKVAIPLHPEHGTSPNVFYVPPVGPASFDASGQIDETRPRIPDEYLVSLFGVDVRMSLKILQQEKEIARAGGKSELMDLLIGYRWVENFGGLDVNPSTLIRPATD